MLPGEPLRTGDRQELLNVIDEIRSQGISRYVDLPQMIVVGDQSAGKSSLLEAISGVSFPTKDNLCTRFATELILRRSEQEKATVQIISKDGNSSAKAKVQKFGTQVVDFNSFPKLYEDAKIAMGIDDDGAKFSDDVLRIEVCGPNLPHLTLIDLPGLFHVSDRDGANNDHEIVKNLVMSYMERPRTIILAVVSAKNDFNLQIATRHTRDIDPDGKRTLGVITKPDSVPEGSDSEQFWIDMATNKKTKFALGWHVVRNRDYAERDVANDGRDANEKYFFGKGAGGSLNPRHVGIVALRSRLSTILNKQIQDELPAFVNEVNMGIDDCSKRLAKLGESRKTSLEQRNYLYKMSHVFSFLARATVDGLYRDPFFGDPLSIDGSSKRLRAVVQNKLKQYSDDIRLHGYDTILVDDAKGKCDHSMTRTTYIEDVVLPLMRSSRGCELPGTFNPLMIGDLFYRQSRPWKALVDSCAEELFEAARQAVMLILDHIADESTFEGLRRHMINPALDKLWADLQKWVKDILEPHQQGHPITFNHYFTDNVQKFRNARQERELDRKLEDFFDTENWNVQRHQPFSLQSLKNALIQDTEVDMDLFACSQAVDSIEAYYNVS